MKIEFFRGIDGQLMAYHLVKKKNSKKNIVFIHGLGADLSVWKYQYQFFLDKGYNVCGIDLRGHGKSSTSKHFHYYTLDKNAKDLEILVSILGKKKNTILVGHCYGAAVITCYQRLYPNSVKCIVLASISTKNKNNFFYKLIKSIVNFLPFKGFVKESRKKMKYRKYQFFQNVGDWSVTRNLEAIRHTKITAYFSTFANFFTFDERITLKKTKIPVLVVVGENDTVFRKWKSKEITRLVKNSRLEILKDTNHIIVSNNPYGLNSALVKGLKELKVV